jgi:hypothetical protein
MIADRLNCFYYGARDVKYFYFKTPAIPPIPLVRERVVVVVGRGEQQFCRVTQKKIPVELLFIHKPTTCVCL